MTQRDKMRKLFARYHGNEVAIASAYAHAEENGEIQRKSNSHNLDSITYAKALIRDERKKGWLEH